MNNVIKGPAREASIMTLSLLAALSVQANPTGGTVGQGAATFNTSGSTLTINTSANTLINWQSFNIGASETTTFVEPTSSSIVWNNIGGSSASQILGTLNANGYVILQNANGFYVGGSAAINTHGLILTTAPTPALNLASGSWQFDAPPPTAQIINYGQINIAGGGAAFLIADTIQNNGTITAEQGKIGLYAGEQVLVSTAADGRGLNAAVTLPAGSVNNAGQLIADGGTIVAEAQTVNQNGLIQANTLNNANGTIELLATGTSDASGSVMLGANSVISAQGAATGTSSGGTVTILSDNTFSDQAGSTISVAGGTQAGNGGQVEISAPTMSYLQSTVNGGAASGYTGAQLNIDSSSITLDSAYVAALNNLISGGLSAVNLQADENIELSTYWTLADASAATSINLTADNNLAVDDYAGIAAGNNWTVKFTAGNTLTLGVAPTLSAYNLFISVPTLTSADGNVTLQAANNLELGSTLTLADPGSAATLNLVAGNNVTLDDHASIAAANNWTVNLSAGNNLALGTGSTISADYLNLGVSGITAADGKADFTALDNIEVSSLLTLPDSSTAATLSLTAGNNITVDDGAGISAGNDWSLKLTAGTAAPAQPASGSDGIYLTSSAFLQTENGDINLWAANEVQVTAGGDQGDASGNSGIRTVDGGNITVTAVHGDVNAGSNPYGYDYQNDAGTAYYTVDPGVGGISTAAGGNVTIAAGGNVYSYLPSGSSSSSVSADDGGSGAFGPEPGNVTVTAGGSVYGHYVLANGVGTITAGKNVGAVAGHPFALSLMDGTWNINAPNGDIYLQEVRNPNGVFDRLSGSGYHLFDYSASAAVDLTAYGVYLTSQNVPRPDGSVPVLYPPILDITAGAGGVTLEGDVTLFPSLYQSLDIVTTSGGNLAASTDVANTIELLMSDSAQTSWLTSRAFGDEDHASTVLTLNDPNPVVLDISGNMENLDLVVTKAAQITVGGDMINCGFSGENLHAYDVTAIKVAGQIYNQTAFAFESGVTLGTVSTADVPSGYANTWDLIFTLALNPSEIASLVVPADLTAAQWTAYALEHAALFSNHLVQGLVTGVNPGFTYNTATGRLGYGGAMAQSVLSELSEPITILHLVNGLPVLDANGHFETDTVNWISTAQLQTLYAASQSDPSPSVAQWGYVLGGPGLFDVSAGSISLGNTYGILSSGTSDVLGLERYNNLASLSSSGATVNVTVAGDLDMLTSTIAAVGGGDVNVTSTGGSMDLGSEEIFNTSRSVGFGIYTTGGGDVNVIAFGDINIDGSRIGTYNGGNILVESLTGNVDVGNGGNTFTHAVVDFVKSAGVAESYEEATYGNGIVAYTLVPPPSGVAFPSSYATKPGNITVETPEGNITADLGGITQQALDGSIAGGPTITLSAGTAATASSPGYVGNIDLGQSGVIGGTVDVTANGNITGLIISRQNTTVQAAQNVDISVLSGGSANVSGGGTISGLIVGVGGVSVSGVSSAEALGQNVSVNGGASQSTLGTSAAATSTSSSAAQTASTDSKQEVASTNNDDDLKKKKLHPLLQRVKRVTVILPAKA